MIGRFLPYGRQLIDEDDVRAVAETLRSDFLTTGPRVKSFENALCRVTGAPFAVACNSGTAALHLAVMAAGIGPGDRVVVPSVTFLATANAVRFVGGEVVFADVDAESGLMNPEDFQAAVARAGGPVKAVMPVHLGGQCADLAGIGRMARAGGAIVIEDACHALGTTYDANAADAPIGACRDSEMAAFSFHPVKTIAMGEAGAVTTRNEALCRRLERLRNHGMSRDAAEFTNADLAFDRAGAANPWYYEMTELGYNYRVSDIHCALGESQLAKLALFVERRRQLAACYDRLLAPFTPSVRPVKRAPACRPAWHLYVVLIDFVGLGHTRAAVAKQLHEAGIGTQVHYIPVHRQPYYRKRYGDIHLPNGDAYYARALSLPLFASMTEADVERVVATLGAALDL